MSKYKSVQVVCKPPLVGALIAFAVALIVPQWYLALILYVIGVIFILDIGARYREYIILVNKFSVTPNVTGRDIKYFRSNLCRRYAAVQAGMSPEIFRALGYRWYHILPDGFPMCFCKRGFWKTLLGIHTPRSK